MSKWLVVPFLLLLVGCTTPPVVFRDIELIKNNLVIQKQITDMLLSNVNPTSDRQVEAVANMRLRIEQRFDEMAATTNRLIIYFKAEKEVGFITNIIDIMLDSELKALFGNARKEVGNEKNSSTIDDAIVYSGDDSWVLGSSESGR